MSLHRFSPVNLSHPAIPIYVAIVSFCLCLIIVYTSHPSFLYKRDKDGNKKIDNNKFFLLFIVIFALSLFILIHSAR